MIVGAGSGDRVWMSDNDSAFRRCAQCVFLSEARNAANALASARCVWAPKNCSLPAACAAASLVSINRRNSFVEHANGEAKVGRAWDPTAAVPGKPAAGHDHVDMRMMRHCRASAVQHRGDADAGAEMLGIGRDSEHHRCRGREQKIVHHGLVVVGDVADRSLRPLPCSTRNIMRLESMSQTFSDNLHGPQAGPVGHTERRLVLGGRGPPPAGAALPRARARAAACAARRRIRDVVSSPAGRALP